MLASVHVDLLRKSAVRRTPNTVPIEAPPNDPARPPPLLDCINTATISKILINNSSVTRIPNMLIPSRLGNDGYKIRIFQENIKGYWSRSSNEDTFAFKSNP